MACSTSAPPDNARSNSLAVATSLIATTTDPAHLTKEAGFGAKGVVRRQRHLPCAEPRSILAAPRPVSAWWWRCDQLYRPTILLAVYEVSTSGLARPSRSPGPNNDQLQQRVAL